jgi:CRISPR-associated protein Cmr5
MPSRDQDRAALAYEHVSQFVGESAEQKANAKKYGTMVHKLPALLQTAGLCQALHFIHSRGDENQKKLLEHLARQLHRVNSQITSTTTLLERARKADLSEYLQLTDEAMACAAWYRRLVQGVLKIDTTDDGGQK